MGKPGKFVHLSAYNSVDSKGLWLWCLKTVIPYNFLILICIWICRSVHNFRWEGMHFCTQIVCVFCSLKQLAHFYSPTLPLNSWKYCKKRKTHYQHVPSKIRMQNKFTDWIQHNIMKALWKRKFTRFLICNHHPVDISENFIQSWKGGGCISLRPCQ
jgi:hypothetical protein